MLHRLVCCCPVLDSGDGILSTLPSREAVRSSSVSGKRTPLFTIGVNRAVYGVAV
jgi:hypothetical protein